MNHHTKNEACTHPKSIKFGKRRRQCIFCRAIWTVRAKKRGPKCGKRRILNLTKTFVEKFTLVQQARRSRLSAGALSKRHAQSLAVLAERPWPHEPPAGSLILVMDAVWFKKDDERYTVYLLGLRAVSEDRLHFLRPVLRYGNESQKQWQEIVNRIPEETQSRILALVSDSFSGAGSIAKDQGWVFQRCQAHLLLRLETLCGDNKRTVSWREGRQELKQLMYALMNTRDEEMASEIVDQLSLLGQDRRCPRKLAMIVTETLRYLHEFRACYAYPKLRLPATTNALENTNGRIRSLLNRARGCRTPQSLIRWITGFLWFNPTVTCRPKLPTELRR
jgi:hypothetical protein